MLTHVRKRDGESLQSFDRQKISEAVSKAWIEVQGRVTDARLLRNVTDWVTTHPLFDSHVADVEKIQDVVEIALMKHGLHDVAKAYILYRQRRAELRLARREPDPKAVADYIHPSKYARYLPEQGRRELFHETVERVEAMHLRRFAHLFKDDPALESDIRWAFDKVREKRLLPSMRSMQFGGPAIESINNRIYNCCHTLVDRPRAFAEAFYLLLCGCGTGFSLQFEHVDKLPVVHYIDENRVRHFTVPDTLQGWAEALDVLMVSYFVTGEYVEFDYSQVRAKGVPLKTSGGKAPGHLKLKTALERIRAIMDGAQGRKLRPIECGDMLCHEADAVLSGGIRRSSMIFLFSLEDSEMMYAKTGSWFKTHPWRQNSNNSVMLKRHDVKRAQFQRIFQMTKEWGEPGFYFCADYNHGSNPCVEIGLNPVLEVNEDVLAMIRQRQEAGKASPDLLPQLGAKMTGWAFCNLTEINASMFQSEEDFMQAAKAASIVGTLQASYTTMPFLGWVSEAIAEREALLGVGMTGILDAPEVATNPAFQRKAADIVVRTNSDIAARIGIRPAARTTCVKPSGTTSLELGCVGSGHHAHHARRYIRRVTANELEPVFNYFKGINPHMCVRKPNGDWVIEFPVAAPDGALVKKDLGALDFLAMVKSTQENWVLPGTARPDSTPGLSHNVSNTVQVQSHEWDDVAEYLWENQDFFTGVSLLPASGDKDYAFAPNEEISTPADEARWNQLLSGYQPVDYTLMREDGDETDVAAEPACAGGSCSIF